MTRDCDVLVIGSGAGGLSAAVTAAHHGLRVIVAEKTPFIGGTTAWSGGWLWIPRNPLAIAAGIEEDIEAPLTYLRSEIGNRAEDPRIRTFLENGPEMVGFFRDHTAVDWIDGNRIPDFHTTRGASAGGRSVCAAPFDGRRLGDWAHRLRPALEETTIWGMAIASGTDMARFFNWRASPANALHVGRRLARHVADLATRGRSTQLVNGNALAARLLRSALDLGVTVLTEAPASDLIRENGRVTGAIIGGRPVRADRGVVLATGGFPHDNARIATMFEHAKDGTWHHSAAPPTNTGDGLTLGESAGGVVTKDYVNPGAWAPVSLVPKGYGETSRFPHLVERAKPGFIAVAPNGRRFVNEADSYHDFMSALFRAGADHAWLIADAPARRRFGIGAVKPFPFRDAPHLATGYLKRGRTLEDLARATGLDPEVLDETITGFNAGARLGEDPDFGRGTTPYNLIQGDPGHQPNPALGALDHGPFYAVRIVPGSLGTFAGLTTDPAARVLDASGAPIPGLFATGNDAASIMGGNYPAGGITLGPAMTYGYIAGRVLAGQPVKGLQTQKETENVL
ncbi:FAD-dependent oxidoreductase [Sinisalibacter lacisalsi]|uniref:FAD-binding dehydrogenase n=1 Tax=Sinisalibacter lacisalsi TaxID=1526570 RepID=A0ABQ1QFA3_9RHOB|nr:FAD-dependent oxidoreductase [Sinisalibacter lacisalsi]GGD25169.1 FAD-binding dehydrogenase [Sinisalibacter lacisalsi]